MKYILKNTKDEVFGAFFEINKILEGYMCDQCILPTSVTGDVIELEVPDDYMSPEEIVNYNNKQTELRAKSYPTQSDPIFFEWQRGTKTEQEWLDAVEQVKIKYPYK